jgi:integrase
VLASGTKQRETNGKDDGLRRCATVASGFGWIGCPTPSRRTPDVYLKQTAKGWQAQVQRNGKRIAKTFPTKREAGAWGIDQEASAKKLKQGWRTFGAAVEQYEQSKTSQKRAQQWEKNTLRRLLAQIGEDTPVGEIDAPRVARWRDERLKTVSGSTVNREANLFRNILTVARDEWEWIEVNPFTKVKLPKDNQARHQVWRWMQIKRVLRAERAGKTREVIRAFHIALHTAMRLSEVLTAKVDGLVAILPKSKTERGLVKVPLARKGVELLQKYGPFTVSPNEASTLFSRLCKELLIEDLTFHDSRGTALTLLSRRVDVLTLSRISRHQDLQILRDHYYRATAEEIAGRISTRRADKSYRGEQN